jgi:hypothetical protein
LDLPAAFLSPYREKLKLPEAILSISFDPSASGLDLPPVVPALLVHAAKIASLELLDGFDLD